MSRRWSVFLLPKMILLGRKIEYLLDCRSQIFQTIYSKIGDNNKISKLSWKHHPAIKALLNRNVFQKFHLNKWQKVARNTEVNDISKSHLVFKSFFGVFSTCVLIVIIIVAFKSPEDNKSNLVTTKSDYPKSKSLSYYLHYILSVGGLFSRNMKTNSSQQIEWWYDDLLNTIDIQLNFPIGKKVTPKNSLIIAKDSPDIPRIAQSGTHRTTQSNFHGTSQSNYYGTTQSNYYGTTPSNLYSMTQSDTHRTTVSNFNRTSRSNCYGTVPSNSYGISRSNFYAATQSNFNGTKQPNFYGTTQSNFYGTTQSNFYTPQSGFHREKYDQTHFPVTSRVILLMTPSLYQVLPIHESDNVHLNIKRRITNRHLKVHSIDKIENFFLKRSYLLKKIQKLRNYPHIEELELFHGTKWMHADSICSHNFNWRFHGKEVGHRFGKGVSFSANAMYASNYSDKDIDEKVMFIAKVLVGKKCLGTNSMKLPPEGSDTSTKGHDNIVVVKYEDNEFYPIYRIKYHLSPSYVSTR